MKANRSLRRHRAAFVVTSLLAAVGTRVFAGPVTGTVRSVVRPATTAATAIVYAEPIDGPAARAPRRVSLLQRNKTFQPRVLAVPVGSTVDFPNNDSIYHNVFSLSAPQPFDLGLYRAGESRPRTFTAPGTYRVFCNIHPQMSAVIVVAPTSYAAVAGPDGRFVFDLPPGRFRVTALSERAMPASVEITSTQGSSIIPDLTLDESSWVSAQHTNKFGKPYPAAAYQR